MGEAADEESKRLKLEWLTFTNLEKSVQEDIKLIKESPLVHDSYKIHGFVYDVSLPLNDSLRSVLMPLTLLCVVNEEEIMPDTVGDSLLWNCQSWKSEAARIQ